MRSRPDLEDAHRIAEENRLRTADLLAGLTPEQWETPSLCAGWTVREVAAHLLDPLERDWRWPSVIREVVRYRGDLDRLMDESTRSVAARPTEELVAGLRGRAATRLRVPMTGVLGPMSDTCIHLRDIARPLGSSVGPSTRAWGPTIDFLVSSGARGYIPRERSRGLRLVATDLDRFWGEGETVTGTGEALALAISGRAVTLPELDGPGAATLRRRLAA